MDLSPVTLRKVTIGDTDVEYGVTADRAHVHSVWTAPAARRRGSARTALVAFLGATDEEGLSVDLLVTPLDGDTTFGGLLTFYRSLGFETTGKRNSVGNPYMLRRAS